MKPYYDEDGITIYHGDCLELLDSPNFLLSLDAELVLTDPPYNVGKDYGVHNDSMAPEDYEAWCADWFFLMAPLARRIILFPGHGNVGMWHRINRPSAIGCWHKPGNPAGGGVIQFCEWEPYLLWGAPMGGSDVVRATVTQQATTGNHPCPKPLRLFSTLIVQSRAQSILDPFMGSGTTLRAAKDLGRKAIGIEIEERYCEIAVQRLGQMVLPLDAEAA